MKSSDLSERQISVWNSLEITKLVVIGVLIPLSGLFLVHEFKRVDDQQVQRYEDVRQLADRRIKLWEDIGPKFNSIYCYYLYVGKWKEIDPDTVVGYKRDIDSIMYTNKMFFTDEFFDAYQNFMKAAFQNYQGWEKDALLLTEPVRPRDGGHKDMFGDCDNTERVFMTYWTFQNAASKEFHLFEKPAPKMPPLPVVYKQFVVRTCQE